MFLLILDTKFRISTVYYPVTDSQTEKTNQSLKQYLKHYINNIYSNWILFLSIIQLVFNAKISDITKITLFFANYSKKSNLFEKERTYLFVQSAIERVAILKKIHNNILRMQERSARYQNKKQKTIF